MSEMILTPIMTSNTEPSGKCNASSQLATNCEAFQAFRQTNSTDPSGYYNWIAAGNVGNWISYEFDTPKKVTKLIVWNMNTSVPRAVKTFIFQGSNDGQNFTDIKTCSIGSFEGGYKSTYAISSEAYRIYRLYITEVYDSDYTAFGRIDLIGDSGNIKPLIPVMTSNTEPSGVVEYSSVWTYSGNYKGYYAFDDNDSTYWAASSQSPNHWISYEFPERKRVTQIFIDAGNEGSSADSYKLQYYNGSDWVDLFDYRTYGNGVSETYSFSNNVYAKKYRVIFGGSSTHNTRTIQLYGYDDIVKGLVPAMTSVNTPEGECILYATGGSPAGDAPFYRVFDGNPSTIGGWANNDVNGTGTKDAYIGYHFTKPIKCAYAEFRWGGRDDSRYIFGVKLQGSNDGTNWVDLSEPVDIRMKTDHTVIESIKPDKYFTYLCIRYISYSTISNIGYPQANEIQFYGTDDPPRIKSSGSTEAIRDWLNASLYNKEEIDDLFIQNNQSGLIPYDLMIVGDQPEQLIKLVGQTSGKVYNLCLAALMGENMINFSTEEQKTGIKWIDGKDVYQKTVVGDTMPTSGQTYITGVDELVCSFGAQLFSGGSPLRWYDFPFTGNSNGPRAEVDITTHNLNVIWGSGVTFTKYRWTFLYTKV